MKFKTSFSLEEVNRCLLCNEAKCSKACPAMLDPAGILRSIKFDNLNGAATRIKNTDACVGCSAPCEQSCCLKNPIDIRNILLSLKEDAKSWEDIPESDVDLSCDFLGVHFENPFLLSSSVVASSYEKIARAFDMGWAELAIRQYVISSPRKLRLVIPLSPIHKSSMDSRISSSYPATPYKKI